MFASTAAAPTLASKSFTERLRPVGQGAVAFPQRGPGGGTAQGTGYQPVGYRPPQQPSATSMSTSKLPVPTQYLTYHGSCFFTATCGAVGELKDSTTDLQTREIYCRPPKDGRPNVHLDSLMQVNAGVYGLTEELRLGDVKASRIFTEAGWEELNNSTLRFTLLGSNDNNKSSPSG